MSRTAAQIPDFTGRLIHHGRYRLSKVLGTGAYGVVYLARDLSFAGKLVERAIKILDKRHLDERGAIRVKREIVLHHVVSEHPNVVTVHHAFEDTMFVYIVMDYCPGGDLFSRIADDKMFFRNDDMSKSVFLKIIDAVLHCHEARVFHRDLKPENILCSKDGSQVHVTDFGLCTSGRVSTTWGCGSGPYMSPECIGKDQGYLPYSCPASDVWSLGVILLSMITSRSPWQKAVTADGGFVDFLLNKDYLRELLPISEGANVLFRKIFTYEPDDRITLSALRQEIIALDSFFMTDDEIARAGQVVRDAAEYCGHHVHPVKGDRPAPQSDDLSAVIGTSSVDDSEGPITPASCAVHLETYLPELELGLAGLEITGLIKEEKLPPAPRLRQSARAFKAA